MFDHLTRRPVQGRRGAYRPTRRAPRRMFNSWEHLEARTLLTAPPLSMISENLAGNGADVGALFPSVSSDGRYIAFESGSFQGVSLPAPSDLVSGLTVANDAPNVYLRDIVTNTTICLSLSDKAAKTTGNDDSRYPVISANGNTVVFLSNATDLVPNDNASNNPDDKQNVFAWSRATGKLTLVTVNDKGTAPANDPDTQQYGTAENVGISADGNYIIYDSEATDLVPGENNVNYTPNVYVYDMLTNKNILVSRNYAGNGIGDGPSDDAVISADGSTVAFDSEANDLTSTFAHGAPFDSYQVYMSKLNHSNDTVASTTMVSVDPAGTHPGNDTSGFPSISDNGQVVAFQSSAQNLVSLPNGGSLNDAYVRNLSTNTTQLVSVDDTGHATGDSSSFDPQISGDGDHVLFFSLADNLVSLTAGDGTSYQNENVYERNLSSKTTRLVSINHLGTNSGDNTSTLANQSLVNTSQQETGQISDNGQYVTFDSVADDLVPNFQQKNGGPPYGTDVYLRDTVAGTTTLLSHAHGTTTTGDSGIAVDTVMTPSGGHVAFQSAFPYHPDNLDTSDTNGQTQLFLADLGPAISPPVTTTKAATSVTSSGATLQASVNPQGNATTYDFVYGTDPTLKSGTSATSSQSAGSGTGTQSVHAALTGLNPNTTYFFEVQATNAGGTTHGSILEFTTSTVAGVTPPSATTETATSVEAVGAALQASVNPEGSATTYRFIYGTDPSLSSGTITTVAQSAGSGHAAQTETAVLTDLAPGTTYYDRVVASNAGGTTKGAISSFTTSAVIQFSSGQFTANITAGIGQVVLTRTGSLQTTLSVVLSSPGGHEVAPFTETISFGPNVQSMSVPITLVNDGQPGEGNSVISLSLSSPGAGATVGGGATASLVIFDDNPFTVPPAPLTVTSLQPMTIKVGSGKKGKKASVLVLQFSDPVEGASNLGAYVLMSGKKKGKTTFTRRVPLKSAIYNDPGMPTNSVTLFLGGKLKPSTPGQLTVNGSLITDAHGQPLAKNLVVTFSNHSVSIQ